jgi:hypothetical protein
MSNGRINFQQKDDTPGHWQNLILSPQSVFSQRRPQSGQRQQRQQRRQQHQQQKKRC